jgi:hypothetical protein
MVMREDGDGEKNIITKYAATTFWGKPFAVPFGNWLCSSFWFLGCLSILFRWSLVSWWHFGGVSVV